MVRTYEFVSHYFPRVLEAMRTRWISPQFVATNRVDSAGDYDELKVLGRRVNAALGIGTSATHMEWFFGPKGLRFSEIGCRPSGRRRVGPVRRRATTSTSTESGPTPIVHGRTSQRPSRRYAAGMIALRPDGGRARSAATTGVEEMQARYGEWVIDAHLPDPGTPTQPVEAGYMANAYVRMKHPDYDVLRGMLDDVGETVTVHAG